MDCLEMQRENYLKDINYCYDDIETANKDKEELSNIDKCTYDFIYYHTKCNEFYKENEYFLSCIQILKFILQYQKNDGLCLIKISTVFSKPILDILYILSSLYEKVYIIKPNTSNITTFEKYIVCKKFILTNEKEVIYNSYINKINIIINNYIKDENIKSIINFDIPYYFLNKIDDMNIIIGQQQLEALDQVINIIKNKNKDDKIETLKKTNIQKSVNWCEKFKIPCNKFSDKINIFLPIIKEIKYNEANTINNINDPNAIDDPNSIDDPNIINEYIEEFNKNVDDFISNENVVVISDDDIGLGVIDNFDDIPFEEELINELKDIE
jgi:hypothetical protein